MIVLTAAKERVRPMPAVRTASAAPEHRRCTARAPGWLLFGPWLRLMQGVDGVEAGRLQMLISLLFQPPWDHAATISPFPSDLSFISPSSFLPTAREPFSNWGLGWPEPFYFSSFIFLPFYWSEQITDPSWISVWWALQSPLREWPLSCHELLLTNLL